ncbi:AfsR/SARP family transcriptional regulator [Glycomyces artemisiae]|uniref:DNA-binding SARP family transcriptional activator n=1 Tax=Glycomyces artemisiae TaxID=1076443 RepID=A0A2T0UEJ0_9ACTN|nr:BTAD domain-containing putative transcriptional regulator [Glycomyces artemisiae]PRY56237.1 DNA-binding SARP family transcriptional activator [Glycomyces artemisiae]
MLQYRILGPPEVLRDGRAVPLPGLVPIRLLAILLLEPDRAVPMHRLIAGLWADDPPATARRQVQNKAALLRRALGADAITPAGDGYRAALRDAALDADDFHRALRDAKARNDTGDHAAALQHLRDGLDLWRGPALAGLTGPLFESGARRLEAARLDAVEQRIDLELALGDPPPVAELRELLDADPLRQRTAAQLMRALHATGRTPEALQVYRQVRTALADDLGLDPDARLQAVHTAILRADDTPAPPAPIPTAPELLPAPPAALAGRDDALADLDKALQLGNLATLSGPGGVGKTALALTWADRHRDRYPDGQLYIDLHGFDAGEPLPPRQALAQFLKALGQTDAADPDDLDDAVSTYRRLLSGRQVIVVLDNARDAAQIRPLLPRTPGSRTIVTSRNRLTGLEALDDARPVPLERLDTGASLDLLAATLGPETLTAATEAVRRLADLCGGLPLALRIAAANFTAQTRHDLAGFAAELAGADRLDALAIDGDPDAAVTAVFDNSLRALDASSRDALLRLGFVPGGGVRPGLAAAVTGLPPAEVERTLRRLETVHLLESPRSGRLRFHDLVAEYLRRRSTAELTAAQQDAIMDGACDWYAAHQYDLASEDYPEVERVFRAWRAHRPALRLAPVLARFTTLGQDVAEILALVESADREAARHGDADDRYRIAVALSHLHCMAGNPHSGADFARRAAAEVASLRDGDAEGRARGSLGATLGILGRLDEAEPLLREALAAAEAAGQPQQALGHLANLGVTHWYRARFTESEHAFDRAIALADELGDAAAAMESRTGLAILCLDTGRLDAAAARIAEVAAAADAAGSERFRIMALLWGGELHRLRGRYEDGIREATLALDMARESGRHPTAWSAQNVLADLLGDAGRPHAALDLLRLGRTERRQLAYVRSTRRDHLICKLRNGIGDFGMAADHGRRARAEFAEMPAPLWHARTLAALAESHRGLGEEETAADLDRRAELTFTELGCR